MLETPLIAVVDDDETVREAVAELLYVLGVPCKCFDRAEAFLEAYIPGQFAWLLTDVRMPGMGGLELLRRVKAMEPSMPVIVLTSYRDSLLEARALECGATAYLTKPVADCDIIDLLASAIDHDLEHSPLDERGDSGNG
ncbi:response regulator transcription factor [Sinorhizobium mexicanum]|uniref:response regulator transcription factor n=1 Tax=Sinorhizobium mexicanum TaxID=375549 RepID=UPI0015DE9DA8|nr:response regulator [Sinorhizobium mexicanum]MBP1884269.1 FixJ family two-component response regulator [Sinorhizobium mexicanum]